MGIGKNFLRMKNLIIVEKESDLPPGRWKTIKGMKSQTFCRNLFLSGKVKGSIVNETTYKPLMLNLDEIDPYFTDCCVICHRKMRRNAEYCDFCSGKKGECVLCGVVYIIDNVHTNRFTCQDCLYKDKMRNLEKSFVGKLGNQSNEHWLRIEQVKKLVEDFIGDRFLVSAETESKEILVDLSDCLWSPNKHLVYADFMVEDLFKERILYGEVGNCNLDKIFVCYIDKQLLWISKDNPYWETNVVYFDKGVSSVRSLRSALSYWANLPLVRFLESKREKIKEKYKKSDKKAGKVIEIL